MQVPKTAKQIAAGHLVGVKITINLTTAPVTVIKAEVIEDDTTYRFEGDDRSVIHASDIRMIYVVCRGGCKTLFNPRSEYSPDLCDKCWMEFHNP